MCGICGFWGFKNKTLLKDMTKVLNHRGPDDYGFYSDKSISLGHRRLSIIDLSKKAKQPMFNEDRSIVIVYNGEIYNFKEIKHKLKGKHKFKSNSDTEVIIHAYEEYGVDCVKLFNGMFAFAIWDKKKKMLFLARDRLGIKPLYYFYNKKKFVFASEIKAILKDKSIKKELNETSLVDYLTFQNIMDNKTFFKNINILLPAHSLIFRNGKTSINEYWKPNYSKKCLNSQHEYIKKFQKIFKDSIKRHMISDVSLGSYLSGGFDSSSVVAIASEISKNRMETFTGRFDEGGKYDETPVSREVAKKVNAKVHEVTLKPNDFLKSINDIIYHLDEPKVALPAFSQYHVSKLVSRNVKVVLTGHGGDELFAGYPIYKTAYFKQLLKKNPFNFLRIFNFVRVNEIPRFFYFLFFPLFSEEVKHGLFIMFNKNQRKKLFTKKFYSKIKDYNPSNSLERYLRSDKLSESDKVQHLYLKTYLPSLFIVEDKLSMAHSIEARIPMCDNELIDFALSIPIKNKLYKNNLKYIIKESMRTKLPKNLYKQPKLGFPTPLSIWFRKELRSYIYDLLLDEKTISRGIFNKFYIKKLLDQHCSSKTDTLWDLVNANRIWSLINIELWFRIFIDKEYEI